MPTEPADSGAAPAGPPPHAAPDAPSDAPPPIPERPIPRGCNPLVFGFVAATIQFALTLYFMRSC